MPDVTPAIQRLTNRAQWREMLVNDYSDTADRLQAAYEKMLPELQKAAGDFNGKLADYYAINGELPSADAIKGMKTYQELLARVETDMRGFGAITDHEAGLLADRAITLGGLSAEQMTVNIAELFGPGGGAFNRPDPVALRNVANYVDSPAFREATKEFGKNASQSLGDVILASIAQGKNPEFTARLISNWYSVPYSWSNNTVRTTQMWSYRTANHEAYRMNADVVEGWVWWADLSGACSACIAMHGTKHTLDETLDGHHGCRCTPVPIVLGSNWQNNVTSGPDWFDEQSAAKQRDVLGPGKFDLYQEGKFNWDKATQEYHNDIFGVMRREATLDEAS